MSFEPFPEEYLRQLEAKYGERRNAKFNSEYSTVKRYFEAVSAQLADTYTIEKVLAVGGTGIVHTGQHNRFHQPIVLKINRPNDGPEVSMVAKEALLLPTLSHPNIIPVLDLRTLCDHTSGFCDCDHHPEKCDHPQEDCDDTPKLTYIVEPFITGSKPFFTNDPDHVKDTWLYGRTEELKRVMPDTLELGCGDDPGQAIVLITFLLAKWLSCFLNGLVYCLTFTRPML